MKTRTEYLAALSESLERMERVYDYVNNATDGPVRFESLRLCILAKTHISASIAGTVNGTISLPHSSWNISRADLDPRTAVYVR